MNIKRLFFLLALAICGLPTRANPILARYFSEVMVDSTHWLIELNNPHSSPISLDACSLVSSTSRAAFKKGLFLDENYLVVSQDNLENAFHINPTTDVIELVTEDSVLLDRFFFSALREGQSWCLHADWYYLDNSPTFGQSNDTLNAMCQIIGSVTDTVGNPIEGIAAYWDHATTWPESTLALDSSGHFSIRVLASSITFTFQKENYDFLRAYVSAYPESTITVHFTLKSQSPNSVAHPFNEQLRNYSLADNYPNPFNGSTFFSYQIAHDEFVDVSIYDLMGRLVENLFSGFQTKGEYRLMWGAFSAPSGIYIYRLRTSRVTISKKCILMK